MRQRYKRKADRNILAFSRVRQLIVLEIISDALIYFFKSFADVPRVEIKLLNSTHGAVHLALY